MSKIKGTRPGAGPRGSKMINVPPLFPDRSANQHIGTKPSNAHTIVPSIEVPTDEIPSECGNLCTWVVVRARTRNLPALSYLKYPSRVCTVHGGLL